MAEIGPSDSYQVIWDVLGEKDNKLVETHFLSHFRHGFYQAFLWEDGEEWVVCSLKPLHNSVWGMQASALLLLFRIRSPSVRREGIFGRAETHRPAWQSRMLTLWKHLMSCGSRGCLYFSEGESRGRDLAMVYLVPWILAQKPWP